MAKRFARKDPKVGDVHYGRPIVHRFINEGKKYYVVREPDDSLVLWDDSEDEGVNITDEQE